MAGRGGGREARVSTLDGKPPEEADFANYFCTYAFLYHQVWIAVMGGGTRLRAASLVITNTSVCCLQKDMLEDHKRTGAYYNAVMMNRRQFEGKVWLQHDIAAVAKHAC